MPDRLVINGGKELSGEIDVRGSKNAATPMIAATLLTKEPTTINNLPLIADVHKMIQLIETLGAEVSWNGERSITVDAADIDPENLDQKLVAQMRSSILIMGPLLARFGKLSIRHPGGCLIGARPIDTHLNGLRDLGVKVDVEEFGASHASGDAETKKAHMYHLEVDDELEGGEVVLDEFSVTGTENVLMAASLASGTTTLKIAAAEPHVENLATFLNKMGANIQGGGANTLHIEGVDKLKGTTHDVIYDYLEAGTFIIMGLAAKGEVAVENVPVDNLDLFLSKLQQFGAELEVIDDQIVKVGSGEDIEMPEIQALPYPGIPTDLQSPLGVLATQAKGLTLIHDPMYEGRLKYLEELNKMGAEIVMCDPHRAIINGPTQLHGTKLDPLDLRAGAALIIAGIIAEGTTIIKDVSQADRGYEEIEKRLRKVGVDVKRVKK